MSLSLRASLRPRMSWGAALAGCTFSLVAYLALSILGTAIGAASIDPLHEANPVSGLGAGTGIWLVASTLVSVAVGAFVAGRLATARGGLHGLLSWAVTSLITLWLVASVASSAVNAAAGLVGKGLSLTGAGIATAAPAVTGEVKEALARQGISIDWNDLRGQLDALLRESGKAELNPDQLKAKANDAATDAKGTAQDAVQAPLQASDALTAWFQRIRAAGKPAIDAADRQALVNIIQARTGKSAAESQVIADNYVQTYQRAVSQVDALKRAAERKSREAADAAARGVSQAAWASLIMLILGAGVAFAAGVLGRRSDPVID